MSESVQNQLVADLARDVVSQTAPQELPLFRAHSEAYFKDPRKALTPQQGKDEMLGFGGSEAIMLLTPIALAVTNEVIQFIASEVAKSVKAEGAATINDLVKQMFKKFRPAQASGAKTAPTLTPAQLAQVRQLALEKARELKLADAKANLLADSLVGSLAVTS